jgi:inhibitor of KinA sporulation pathway (predicted exonuclease)
MVPEITTLTGITVETLQEAPSVQAVWEQFAQYVNKFNAKKILFIREKEKKEK